MNPARNALVARWDAAREAILARFDRVLSEVTAVSEPLAAGVTTDSSALQRMWQPVEAKMHAMTGEVSDAWDEISDEMSELDGAPEQGVSIEGNKRDAATTEIEIRHGRVRAAIFAKVAVAMHQHVRASGDSATVQMFVRAKADRSRTVETRCEAGDGTDVTSARNVDDGAVGLGDEGTRVGHGGDCQPKKHGKEK